MDRLALGVDVPVWEVVVVEAEEDVDLLVVLVDALALVADAMEVAPVHVKIHVEIHVSQVVRDIARGHVRTLKDILALLGLFAVSSAGTMDLHG